MKETSKNRALLAQAAFVHNPLRQSKAWTLVSANTRCRSVSSSSWRRTCSRAANSSAVLLGVQGGLEEELS